MLAQDTRTRATQEIARLRKAVLPNIPRCWDEAAPPEIWDRRLSDGS